MTAKENMIQNGYRVSKATVYNTIDLLLEANLVRKHQFGSNLAQYERVYNAKHPTDNTGKRADAGTVNLHKILFGFLNYKRLDRVAFPPEIM